MRTAGVELGFVARPASPSEVLLVGVNLLNVADAALTALWIQLAVATEANPIADFMGPAGKIAWVAALSLVLHRFAPRALLVPGAVYGAVIVYHVAGGAAFVVL